MSDGSSVPFDAIRQSGGNLPEDAIKKAGPIDKPSKAKVLDTKAFANRQKAWEIDKSDLLPTADFKYTIDKQTIDNALPSKLNIIIGRLRNMLAPKSSAEQPVSQPQASVTSEASRTFGYRGDGSPKTTMPTAAPEAPAAPTTPPTGPTQS